MVRLQASTGYAFRILEYLYMYGKQTVKSGELAEKLNLSSLYLMKVLRKLKESGLVKSEQGCNGGYRMVRDADRISVFEVFCAMEGELRLYEPQTDIRYNKEEQPIKEYFDKIEDVMVFSMRRTSLRELFDQSRNQRYPTPVAK